MPVHQPPRDGESQEAPVAGPSTPRDGESQEAPVAGPSTPRDGESQEAPVAGPSTPRDGESQEAPVAGPSTPRDGESQEAPVAAPQALQRQSNASISLQQRGPPTEKLKESKVVDARMAIINDGAVASTSISVSDISSKGSS